jgi:uncharacterized protein (TIGR02271 family)
VRLKKYVVEDQVTETVPVRREEVRLEREPITDANVDAALDGPDISEEEHQVTLHAEEPVVEKRAVPKERVRLEKDVETEEREVSGTVRSERIDVDDDRSPARDRPGRRPSLAAPGRSPPRVRPRPVRGGRVRRALRPRPAPRPRGRAARPPAPRRPRPPAHDAPPRRAGHAPRPCTAPDRAGVRTGLFRQRESMVPLDGARELDVRDA